MASTPHLAGNYSVIRFGEIQIKDQPRVARAAGS
jgi:hypothetical protein